MKKTILLALSAIALLTCGYFLGSRQVKVAYAGSSAQEASPEPYRTPIQATVPGSYGRLVAAIPDQIGTGLVFEDQDGVIRFVSVTGRTEGKLERYDQTPTHGGIPKSYGHLVAAVVNQKGTGLIFEDAKGTIRFLTLAGEKEAELTRN